MRVYVSARMNRFLKFSTLYNVIACIYEYIYIYIHWDRGDGNTNSSGSLKTNKLVLASSRDRGTKRKSTSVSIQFLFPLQMFYRFVSLTFFLHAPAPIHPCYDSALTLNPCGLSSCIKQTKYLASTRVPILGAFFVLFFYSKLNHRHLY